MTEKKSCFVVGPIGEEGSPIRQKADWLLKGIIRPVLEADDLGYKVKRADDDASPGSISSVLINDVMKSDLVVADMTGFNPNAFYELGIRHTVQKPTIHIIAERVKLPFDNLDQRAIFVDIDDFDSVETARRQLYAAAVSITSAEYKVTNPVTLAGGIAQLKVSADPIEKMMGDVLERLSRLEQERPAPAIVGQGPFATMTQKEAERSILAATYSDRARSLLSAAAKVQNRTELDILRAASIIHRDIEERQALAARIASEKPDSPNTNE